MSDSPKTGERKSKEYLEMLKEDRKDAAEMLEALRKIKQNSFGVLYFRFAPEVEINKQTYNLGLIEAKSRIYADIYSQR